MIAVTTASIDNWAGLVVAVALIGFMLVALIRPEGF